MASVGFIALANCTTRQTRLEDSRALYALQPDPDGYMDLPEGFSYEVISKVGQPMSDGLLVPGCPDGMGAFLNENNDCVLVRNHENSPGERGYSPFGADHALLSQVPKDKLYDAGNLKMPGLGGTTTIVFDETQQTIKEQYLSLAGTYRNCAGGPTPWGSWLTCEEDVTKSDGKTIEKNHGYVFEVPAAAKGLVDPKPIAGMGRFNHEAVAVDPATGMVYQTEDRPDGLIYRYVPNNPDDLHQGGQLQCLAIEAEPSKDTRNWNEQTVKVHDKLPVTWQPLDRVDAPDDDLRYRGFDGGAARFARGEGMWYAEGAIYFACTNGGPSKVGQIWKYTPQAETLELFAQSESKTVLHKCDNITFAPFGQLLVCEDNGEENRLHLIDQEGNISLFAVNRSSRSEFAGAVFSPTGKTLFVNIQENGETVAITGPWHKFKV